MLILSTWFATRRLLEMSGSWKRDRLGMENKISQIGKEMGYWFKSLCNKTKFLELYDGWFPTTLARLELSS